MNNITIIAGTCQHESFDISYKVAKECHSICKKYNIDYYYKSSFDKANRTNNNSIRGLGLEKTLDDFKKLKKEINSLKITTDVHESEQIDLIENNYKNVIDVYQIPAFLCRQTNLIKRAASTLKPVNIKKGQFISPNEVSGILTKTENTETWVTDRGYIFGYNNLVIDFIGLKYMVDTYKNTKIFIDLSHSLQTPGSNLNSTGGRGDYIFDLARATSALGVSNFFVEVHPDPKNSPSDSETMLKLEKFEELVKQIIKYKFVN